MPDREPPSYLAEPSSGDPMPSWRGVAWMTALFWVSSLAAFAVGDVLRGEGNVANILGMRGLLTMLGMSLCFLIHLLLARYRDRSFRFRVVLLVVVAPVLAELFAWANYIGMELAIEGAMPPIVLNWQKSIVVITEWTWLFLAWAGFYFALQYAAEAKDKERRAAELQVLARDAKLQALAYQINPHFLFNSLNAISALILDGELSRAERVVTRLSQFLRRTLTIDPAADLTLKQEIAIQREYLLVEQQRFPDLAAEFDIPEALEQALVPALSLQPLVENAVKHGVARCAPPAWIRIAARAESDMLEVTVENSACDPGATIPVGTGVGLANVRERLERRYGKRARLIAARRDERIYCAAISLPLDIQGES